MNAGLSYFSAGVHTSVPVATLSVQKTSAEIMELSLRTPRPVAIYLCESEATATNVFCSESEATATIMPRHN